MGSWIGWRWVELGGVCRQWKQGMNWIEKCYHVWLCALSICAYHWFFLGGMVIFMLDKFSTKLVVFSLILIQHCHEPYIPPRIPHAHSILGLSISSINPLRCNFLVSGGAYFLQEGRSSSWRWPFQWFGWETCCGDRWTCPQKNRSRRLLG